MMKRRTKNHKFEFNKEKWNQLLEYLSTEDSVEKIEKMSYEGFKKFIHEIGTNIGGLDSKKGWKSFKAITKYNLVGKKEGQVLQCVRDKDGNVVTGYQMQKVIIEYIKVIHKAADPSDAMDIQIWDFDMYISIHKAKKISKEISNGKALSWDCIKDSSFKLCKKCYDGIACGECMNVVQRIRDVFRKEFWQRKLANMHFKSRLIPLDKTFPKITGPEEAFRPICVSSTVIRI